MVAALALAGCTATDPGQPLASGQATATSGSTSTPSSVAIPPRPRDITLDGLDPCKLFTKTQLDQIKINRQRNTVQTEATFKGAPLCQMDGQDGQVFFHYTVWLITTEGIEPWLDGKRNADAKLVSVDGFPAATYKVSGTTTFNCWTSVDVAKGQELSVEFRPVTRDAFTQDQMCQTSQQAAAFAVQTLKTLK
jgi:hypothetical protein